MESMSLIPESGGDEAVLRRGASRERGILFYIGCVTIGNLLTAVVMASLFSIYVDNTFLNAYRFIKKSENLESAMLLTIADNPKVYEYLALYYEENGRQVKSERYKKLATELRDSKMANSPICQR